MENYLRLIVPKNREEVAELREILGVLNAAIDIGVLPDSFKFGEHDICFAGLDSAKIGEFLRAQRSELSGLFE